MAEIVTNFRMSPSVNFFYNVSHGVGSRRRNQRQDTLLVQFFLNHVQNDGGSLIRPSLSVDGIFGRKTQAAIRRFQEYWNTIRRPGQPRVAEDSVVSPARGSVYGDGSMTWTILALNVVIAHPRNFGLELYTRIHTHPNCPPELVAFFAAAPRPLTPALPPPVEVLIEQLEAEETAAGLSAPPPSENGDGLADPGRGSGGLGASGSEPGVRQNGSTADSRPRPSRRFRDIWTAERLGRPRRLTPPRPYDPHDPGVLWARYVLRPGRNLFSRYEYSELMETMEGTGSYSLTSRLELLRQATYFIFGETMWMTGATVNDVRELLRQHMMLGGYPRLSGHEMRY